MSSVTASQSSNDELYDSQRATIKDIADGSMDVDDDDSHNDASQPATTLYIPIRESEETVAISTSDLPTDTDLQDLIDLLKVELVHPDLWLRLAVEYYLQSKDTEFLSIMAEITNKEAMDAYAGEQYKGSKIQILNTLAYFYTLKGTEVSDSSNSTTRQQQLSQANNFYNLSTQLDMHVSMTWVGKGLLQLLQGDINASEINFRLAVQADTQKENTVAYLGKAAAHYHLGQYKLALQHYFQALQLNPQLPPSVRLGIAASYFAMGDMQMARRAFERVLQLDEQNVHAILGLAVIAMNSQQTQDAVEAIFAAYKLSVQHQQRYGQQIDPAVMMHIANYLFVRGKINDARETATRALTVTKQKELRAELLYIVGKCHHIQSDLPQAGVYYTQAVQQATASPSTPTTKPSHRLAMFGLAQTLIASSQHQEAIRHLETLHKLALDNHEPLFEIERLLGSCYRRVGRYDESYKLLQHARTQHGKNDLMLLLELLNVGTIVNPAEAYSAYKHIEHLLTDRYKKAFSTLPATVLHNFAVVCQRTEHYDEAHTLYLQALQLDSDASSATLSADSIPAVTPSNITTLYNLALLYDTHPQMQSHPHKQHSSATTSAAIYNAIIQYDSEYIDAYLRLGIAEQQRQNYSAAENYYKLAFSKRPTDLNSNVLLGNLALQRNDLELAMKQYDKLKGHNKDKLADIYSTIQFANLHVKIAINRIKKLGLEQKGVTVDPMADMKAGGALAKAARYYRLALSQDKKNVYAAIGLAICLAYEHRLSEAKDILLACREVAPHLPDIYINLGHIYTQSGQHLNATQAYTHVLKSFIPPQRQVDSTTLHLYIAKANYEYENLLEAKQTLLQALHIDAHDPLLYYNIALTQEALSLKILQRRKEDRTLGDVQHAIDELGSATKTFERLSSLDKAYDPQRLAAYPIRDKSAAHLKFSKTSLDAAMPHLEYAKTIEVERRMIEEQALRSRAELEAKQQAEREAREVEERLLNEKLEVDALEKRKELDLLKSEWAAEQAAAKALKEAEAENSAGEEDGAFGEGGKKKRKGKKKAAAAEGEEGGEEVRKRKSKSTKKKRRPAEETDSDAEARMSGDDYDQQADYGDGEVAAAPIVKPTPGSQSDLSAASSIPDGLSDLRDQRAGNSGIAALLNSRKKASEAATPSADADDAAAPASHKKRGRIQRKIVSDDEAENQPDELFEPSTIETSAEAVEEAADDAAESPAKATDNSTRTKRRKVIAEDDDDETAMDGTSNANRSTTEPATADSDEP